MLAFQRGFFCADQSLRYPYRDCTITIPLLVLYTLLLPMLFIAVVEIMRICKRFRLRKYACNMWHSLGTFSFGYVATYLTTELAKNVVGRLRPHFYAACQPRLSDGSSCESLLSDGQLAAASAYIEHYYCANRELNALQLRELHVSFPSAHSSLGFYAMLLLAFYLHSVWRGRGSARVLRHILQLLLLLVALYIALSRVRDYWHHWSDVLAGALLGVVYGALTAIYVGDMLQRRDVESTAEQSLAARHAYQSHQRVLLLGNSSQNVQQQQLLPPHKEQQQQQLQHHHQHPPHQQQQLKEHLLESGTGSGNGSGSGNLSAAGIVDCEWKLQAVVLPT